MTRFEGNGIKLKRAVVFSLGFHIFLFVLIAVSPTLPKPARKGMIHYVRFGSLPGGGGGGGQNSSASGPAQKETLKDLTLSSKVKPEAKPSLTYPVDKPKKERKAGEEKKAAITKPSSNLRDAPANAKQGIGSGGGSGLRIGLGEGPGSGGFGSGYGDQVGLSDFPYQYYLQIITDRVSASWFTSLVDPGVSGAFYATVYFKILRNGQISDLKVVESSGIPSLDLSAQRAIQTTAPFPPLPNEYEGSYLGIHLIFEHSK